MRDWFSKNLGDALLAQGPLDRLEELLSSSYASAGSPDDMAAFIRHESEGLLYCEVKVYFSPGFFAVAKMVDAVPCEKPLPHDLSLLAGSQDARLRLFPECAR